MTTATNPSYTLPANLMQAVVSVVMAAPAGQVLDLALALRQACTEQDEAFRLAQQSSQPEA